MIAKETSLDPDNYRVCVVLCFVDFFCLSVVFIFLPSHCQFLSSNDLWMAPWVVTHLFFVGYIHVYNSLHMYLLSDLLVHFFYTDNLKTIYLGQKNMRDTHIQARKILQIKNKKNYDVKWFCVNKEIHLIGRNVKVKYWVKMRLTWTTKEMFTIYC